MRATFFLHDAKALEIHWNALIIVLRLRHDETDGRLYLAQVLDSRSVSPAGATGRISNDLEFTLQDGFNFWDLWK